MRQRQTDQPRRPLQAEEMVVQMKGHTVVSSEKIEYSVAPEHRQIGNRQPGLAFFDELPVDIKDVHIFFIPLLLGERRFLASFAAACDVLFDGFSEPFLKLGEALRAVGDLFVDEKNPAIQRIISRVYFDGAVIAFVD